MTRDLATWRAELFSEIKTIADRHELELLWSGDDGRYISSFAEEVEHVFSDYDIDGFLAADESVTALSAEQTIALRRFRDEFANYVDMLGRRSTSVAGTEVLRDPKWRLVMQAAAAFVALLEGKA